MTEKKKGTTKADSGKKAYRTPKLVVHGDLRDVTRAKTGGANDGSGKPHTKSPTGTGT
jgi:hypothetical protein